MQGILNALENRAQSMDVQIAQAKPLAADDVQWAKLKQVVDSMTANLNEIGQMIVGCKVIKKSPFGKCGFQGKCHRQTTIIEAYLKTTSKDQPLSLAIVAYVCPEHEYKNLSYVATNFATGVVYEREIKKYTPQM